MRFHLMRRTAASLLCAAALASPALAQVPTSDPHVDIGFGENLVARLGEWYATATVWRNTLLTRARAMLDATRAATQIRQRLETRAVGELGTLGGQIPDWRHLAQFCAVDSAGASTCASSRSLSAWYELVLPSTVFRAYATPLFASVSVVDSVVDGLLRGQHPPGVTLVAEYGATPHEPMVAAQPFAVALGRRGAAVSTTIQVVQAVIDSLVGAEVSGQPLSSGRARQLTAIATRSELLLEADLARTAATALQVSTLEAAAHVSRYRAAQYGGGPGFAW